MPVVDLYTAGSTVSGFLSGAEGHRYQMWYVVLLRGDRAGLWTRSTSIRTHRVTEGVFRLLFDVGASIGLGTAFGVDVGGRLNTFIRRGDGQNRCSPGRPLPPP